MCFAVCAPLQALLSLHGIETELVEVWFRREYGEHNHFWLKLPDDRILDPTADQFGLPAIYLGKMPQSYEGAIIR